MEKSIPSKVDPESTSISNIPPMVADDHPKRRASPKKLFDIKKGGKRYSWDRERHFRGTSEAYVAIV